MKLSVLYRCDASIYLDPIHNTKYNEALIKSVCLIYKIEI